MRQFINAFNAGELSPTLDARTDVEKYRNGCRILENCIPKVQGGAFGRAGMEYMGAAKYPDKACQLIPFVFSETTNFVLELGHLYMRFWSNGLQVMAGGAPVEVATPFTDSDLFAIQYAQVNDVVYFVTGTYAVQKLTRLSDTNWTLAPVVWKWPAFKDQNVTSTTLRCSGVSGAQTLTASSNLFNPGHVGAYFQLAFSQQWPGTNLQMQGVAYSPTTVIQGNYNVFTYGDWIGLLSLERQDASGKWVTVQSWSSDNDRNVIYNSSFSDATTCRLHYIYLTVNQPASAAPPRAVLEPYDPYLYNLVKVTGYTSPTQVSVQVLNTLNSTNGTTAIASWSEGAWSDYRGHPRTVTFDQQRLVFGGNADQPLTFWGSVIGDFENFNSNNAQQDDASYAFQVASTNSNAIVWLSSKTRFFAGTQGDEWLLDGGVNTTISTGSVITPTSVDVQMQSSYGSAYVQPVAAADALMFVQRGRKKIRQFEFDFSRQAFAAPDLLLLAEHLLSSTTIRQMAFASNPDPVLWVVTDDGQLLSMTYEHEQNVTGWSRHPTQGKVESVTVVNNPAGLADEVWVSVHRVITQYGLQTDVRYLERLDPAKWTKLAAVDVAHMIYSDAAMLQTLGSPASVVTGLDHLEGCTVSVLADGWVHPQRTVVNGQISLQAPATVVCVGLQFVPRVQPSKIELNLQDGTSQGRRWKVAQAMVRFWQTISTQYSDRPDGQFFDVNFREVTDDVSKPIAPFTGDKKVYLMSRYSNSMDMTIQQVDPLPFHLLALAPVVDVLGL